MSAENGGFVTELRRLGYAVLPAPRKVELTGRQVYLDKAWALTLEDVGDEDIAVATLRQRLADEHGLKLTGKGKRNVPGKALVLSVRPDAVDTGREQEVAEQAYRLTVAADRIEIAGNGRPGLFYGVQTLLQLLEGDGQRPLVLPAGTITDWPAYELRAVHWDTKHHLDRMETLKRYLDASAALKLNAVVWELEDKFEYPTHPIIGAPGAFTTAQLQELTDYALARHIQIIPNIQAPAHIAFVLKHAEFAHLKCDGSNYQICMDEPEARKLIFDMYEDVCNATKGVKFFHVSTDEVYYAGICEKFRKPYNPENRSLTFVDFVNAACDFLRQRGRRSIIWLEFPLLDQHVKLLPPDVLDGIHSPRKNAATIAAEKARGIRQFAYCPIQGAELLFPNYFDTPGGRGGHLANTVAATTNPAGDFIGSFAAAWDDAGLNDETFWLGWAAMAAGGWTPGAVGPDQIVADFMDIHYGRTAVGMAESYRLLQGQARFFEGVWESRPSKVRGPGYGASWGKFPANRTDWTLLPPNVPSPTDLAVAPAFGCRYYVQLEDARAALKDNDRLLALLHADLARAKHNRHSVEVMIALANLVRHTARMLLAVAEAEDMTLAAAKAAADGRRQQAVSILVDARARVESVIAERKDLLARLTAVWEKKDYPRNAAAGGRKFLHVMDDVKDHFADRRADLSYMTAPEESIGLAAWCDRLRETIAAYAAEHGLSATGLPEEPLDE